MPPSARRQFQLLPQLRYPRQQVFDFYRPAHPGRPLVDVGVVAVRRLVTDAGVIVRARIDRQFRARTDAGQWRTVTAPQTYTGIGRTEALALDDLLVALRDAGLTGRLRVV